MHLLISAKRIIPVAVLGFVLSLSLVMPTAQALPTPSQLCERPNNTYIQLLHCVTVEGVRRHQAAFQAFADRNNDQYYPGTRAAGTVGYRASAAYVAAQLKRAGYQVRLDPFQFQFDFPVVLEQLTPVPPGPVEYESGSFTGGGAGEVTGPVIPVDINLEGDRASTSGCEDSDFAGLDFSGDNDIALIQRGTCFFGDKALNAEEAGAEAVIIFNQGNDPTRMDLIVGTLEPTVVTIPVVGASFEQGVALAQPGSTAHILVIPSETRTDVNVIAEKVGTLNPDNVVMSGAHLDSVTEGPGIQDNGSGSAALLETALQMSRGTTPNTMRFAWWGAEELGLVGSTAYVEGLSEVQRGRIAMYMNYDMVGSPNYIFMVYDADQSSFVAPVVVPPGSEAIEDVYESYYTRVGEPYDDSEFSGRSDYQAFIDAGIPSGGLFTGAEQVKTEEQEMIWGGTAGEQFDPCYHLACDDFDNVNLHALDVNSDLIAFAQLTFAYSTESINGVPGARVPGPGGNMPTPAGPEGTFVEGDGGQGPGPITS